MLRHNWLSMARLAFRSVLCQVDVLRASSRTDGRARRSRLRRGYDFTLGHVAAELCEPRQLLSAAVTAVSPNQATTQGATPVQISGTGFTGVTGVMFGTTPATSYSVTSSNQISAVSPPHAAGQVDVIVDTTSGNSPIGSGDLFNFSSAAATVTGVGPNTGSASGGTSTTISGTGFTSVTAVLFGGKNASAFTVTSATSITAIAPAHTAGTVDVTVVTSGGSSIASSADQFLYAAAAGLPAVTGLGTTIGATAGGTSVTILGTNFTNVTGVLFGGVAAPSFTVNSTTSLTATTPPESPGAVDIKVTNSAGTSATSTADQFTFVTPVLIDTSLNISPGKTSSGTTIAVAGANLATVTAYPAPPSPPAIMWSIPERPTTSTPRTGRERLTSPSRAPVARRVPRSQRTPKNSRTATHPPDPARAVK